MSHMEGPTTVSRLNNGTCTMKAPLHGIVFNRAEEGFGETLDAKKAQSASLLCHDMYGRRRAPEDGACIGQTFE